MIDGLMRRRLDLLWQQYSQASEGEPFLLDGELVASDAGYQDHYGDDYYDVLLLDVHFLEDRDGAVREATDHRSYGVGNMKPYWLTDEGRRLLFDAGYPIEPPREP
jgi:hypothetical protein